MKRPSGKSKRLFFVSQSLHRVPATRKQETGVDASFECFGAFTMSHGLLARNHAVLVKAYFEGKASE